MYYDKRFTSYYVLTILGGARRQITTTFAGYLLVEAFHTPVSVMVLLSAISSVIAIVTRPLIGKVVDGWGEQNSLVVNYSLVVMLFLGYALVRSPIPLFVVYILDNGLIGFDVAITTHLGKIAPKELLSSAYAMGQTVNHITGVGVPALGGLLWKAFGGATVFVSGAAIALLSLLYSRGLNMKEREALAAAQ
jgi:MFS family permease